MNNHSEEVLSGELTVSQVVVLLASILLVALCGIAYELIIGAISSYLLGNSVYQFSVTIGLFMFAMGLGAYLSKLVVKDLVGGFVVIEMLVSLVGGLCSVVLFLVFPYYYFYKPAMFTMIIVIGILVGLEIPLLTRILSQKQALRLSIAHVLSLDYVGALVGSIAFPLLLLPHLGLFRSSFAIGLLNVVVAMVNIVLFKHSLKRPVSLSFAGALIAVVLTICTLNAPQIGVFAENQLYADEVLYRHQSPYQRIVLTRSSRTGHLRLYLDGHIQFFERDEHRYHEALVHPVFCVPGSRSRVLILGGGDGLAAREVLKYGDVQRIDIVDIDPAITRLCRSFAPIRRMNEDSLNSPRVTVHNLDAFIFVRMAGEKYDRVIIDLPDPHDESLSKMYSVEFYRLVARRMNKGGLLATQSCSPFVTREVFWCVAKTLQAAGFSTYSYHVTIPAFGIWGFNLAALAREVPKEFSIPTTTRFLTSEKMVAAGVFGRDTSRVDVPVNSMFEPKLYQLYLKGLLR